MVWLGAGVVYSVLYVTVGSILSASPTSLLWFRTVALLVPPMTGVIVIARRRHVWTGGHWLFWATIALGLTMSGIGLVGWTVDELMLGRTTSWLGWYTVFSLFGGVAPLFALLTQAHRGSREAITASTAVDIAGIAAMTGFLYSHFIVGPDLLPGMASRPSAALLLLSEFQQVVVCIGMGGAAYVAGRTLWGATYRRLTIGLLVNFLILSITNWEIWRGLYETGFVYDVVWIMPFAFYPWAAAAAPTSAEVDREIEREIVTPSRPWVIFGALAVIPLLDYGLRHALPESTLDGFRDLSLVITIFSVLPLLMARLAVERGEAQQADGTRRLLAAATEQADELIAILLPDGRFDHANSAFARGHGHTGSDLTRLTYAEMLADHSRGQLEPIFRRVREEGAWRGSLLHRRADGSTFMASSTLTSLADDAGTLTHFVAVERDITDDNRLREQLIQAKDAAESANRVKGEFLANMSHEIRTPMNGILGMTELVLDTELSAYQVDCMKTVKESATSLLTILNEILDFSKIESKKVELESVPFRLDDAVADTIKPLVVMAEQKGLELIADVAPDVPGGIVGDPVRLKQVLTNLVGNAIKFTEQGHVLVSVGLDGPSDGLVRIRFAVTDTGIGIPVEKHAHIFDAFNQADGSTTRRFGGTGLGLTISAKLVRLMGGTLTLDSAPGRGSTFSFVAPFTPTEAAPRAAAPTDLVGVPVLVVDDNPANRAIFEAQLARRGMIPTSVDGGQAAIAELMAAARAGRPYRLVLLDANMPDLDGFAVASQIRSRPELAGGTIMMLTSSGEYGDRSRCASLGVARYLVKPVREDELIDTIARLLHQPARPAETPQPRAPARATDSPPPSRHSVKVLLAEDNVVNQRVAAGLLKKRGHEVTVVSNGREAVAAVERDVYDVVLMDVQMPEMGGFEATEAIRKREQATARRRQRIIAMTAYAMKGDRERCIEAGMDGYVSKPIDPALLFEAVERPPRSAPPAPPGVVPPTAGGSVNRAEMLARLGGDVALAGDIVRLFLEDCPTRLAEIRAALDAGSAERVRATAHALKGAAGNMSAPALFEAAQALERLGAENNLAGAEAAWATLAEAARHTVTDLQDPAFQKGAA